MYKKQCDKLIKEANSATTEYKSSCLRVQFSNEYLGVNSTKI